MSEMSELDRLIRTHIRAEYYWERIPRCPDCGAKRRIEGFIPPYTFSVRCTNENCRSSHVLLPARIKEDKYDPLSKKDSPFKQG